MLVIEVMDILTPAQRHRCMSAIRGKNTKPEMIVRRMVHAMGFRYRLHRRDLPGTPDMIFSRLGKVIFVHGCFWHRHNCKYGRVRPGTNAAFWKNKRNGNRERDRRVRAELKRLGWEVLVVWECQTRPGRVEQTITRIEHFLQP